MERVKHTTKCAGVDVGKRRLDAALHGPEEVLIQVANSEDGIDELMAWFEEHGVRLVGMEASGGYERRLRARVEAAGLQVVVHQPLEVRLFARLKRWRAKNDRLDACLIAAATAQVDAVRAAQDPRLQELAERMTAYEQVTSQLAQFKVFMEHVTLNDVTKDFKTPIAALQETKAKLARRVLGLIRSHADLTRRLELLLSLPGIGPIVAASLIVRMPELGAMRRGQAASLIGLAPFDRDSGQFKGQRHIGGGRARPRRMLYMAALAAKRFDPDFKAFAQRLKDDGKKPKVVLVAVMRKLVEAANLVLARDQPWLIHKPT